jgi:DNA-binding SARP family transcriptional activator
MDRGGVQMCTLRIRLLGVVHIRHDGLLAQTKICHQIKGLLAYLLLFRHRFHTREVLTGLFWGDQSEDQARKCLSTALWRLRKVLEPNSVRRGTYLMTTSRGEVGFNRDSDYGLDVATLENHSAKFLSKPVDAVTKGEVLELENALALYTGELLEGFYDEWVLTERERLRSLYLGSRAHLMQYYRYHRNYNEGLGCGRKILDLDPLREEIQREMMRLYYANGQRALALRQYESCCKILAEELSVEPMEETRVLYDQICRNAVDDRNRTLPIDLRTARQALHQLRVALREFDDSAKHLQQATDRVEEIFGSQSLTDNLRNQLIEFA